MTAIYLSENICIEINRLNNINAPTFSPPEEATNIYFQRYIGSFYNAPGELWDDTPGNNGITTACIKASDVFPIDESYFFFHVLLAR